MTNDTSSLETSEREAQPCPVCWHTTDHYEQCPKLGPEETDTSSLDTGEGEAVEIGASRAIGRG